MAGQNLERINSFKFDFDKSKSEIHINKAVPIKFKDVYALQIIEKVPVEKRKGKLRIQLCYELNVVHKDFSRSNIIQQDDLKNLIEDSKKFTEVLNIPIWDGTSGLP